MHMDFADLESFDFESLPEVLPSEAAELVKCLKWCIFSMFVMGAAWLVLACTTLPPNGIALFGSLLEIVAAVLGAVLLQRHERRFQPLVARLLRIVPAISDVSLQHGGILAISVLIGLAVTSATAGVLATAQMLWNDAADASEFALVKPVATLGNAAVLFVTVGTTWSLGHSLWVSPNYGAVYSNAAMARARVQQAERAVSVQAGSLLPAVVISHRDTLQQEAFHSTAATASLSGGSALTVAAAPAAAEAPQAVQRILVLQPQCVGKTSPTAANAQHHPKVDLALAPEPMTAAAPELVPAVAPDTAPAADDLEGTSHTASPPTATPEMAGHDHDEEAASEEKLQFKVCFRLPSGKRERATLSSTDQVQAAYDLAERTCPELAGTGFLLVLGDTRQALEDREATLAASGVRPLCLLFVEKK